MSWGRLLGAAAGFALGGPAGAALGMGLGGAAEEVTGGGASGAAREAASTANAAAERELALRQRMYEEGVVRQMPFYYAGTNALARMQGGEYALPPAFTGKVDLGQDPGYAFRLAEGQKALERSAAARGGLLSGATGRALTRYGQEMGSQEYQNAYSRALDAYNAQVQRSATGYNRLASLAGVGQTTAEQLGAAGRGYAAGAGPVISGQGELAANALLAGQRARESSYGQLGSALGKYLYPSQAQFSKTSLGGSGFGTGLAYGNQDYGQFF